VTRPAPARTAACLLAVVATALGTLLVPGPAPASADTPEGDPLEVTIDAMSPSTLPRRGTVTLSGEVTNTSQDTWTDVQAYLVTAAEPIRTPEELDLAARSDPAADLGPPGRITDDGLFTEIGDLAPGESTGYTVRVPRKDLGIGDEPGVYWVGVQVLGAVDGIRDPLADGRARSFMAQMADRGPRADVAVVLPVRDRVRRSTDGRLIGVERWQRTFAPDGRLGRLLALGTESDRPLTWLVDPAVLEAAGSVAHENPPLSTADDGSGPGAEESGSASPSPSPSGVGDPGPSEGAGTSEEPAQEPTEAAQDAADWMAAFVEQTSGDAVLSLPYGDLDVAAVTGNRLRGILRKARALSDDTMAGLGVDDTAAVAPPAGRLPGRALGALEPDTPALLSEEAQPGATGTLLRRPDGTPVVLTDSDAARGGPGPNDRRAPLALRQRILAEAALRALGPGTPDPLVVSAPTYWHLGDSWQLADFFGGLDVPWLHQVDLTDVLARAAEPVDDPPRYPDRLRRAEVPFANQLATQELVDTGKVFASLLSNNDSIADQLARMAMLASSYAARAHPAAALERTRITTDRVRRTMQLVDIDGPGFVMMSSETGPISVTVVNNLDEPVTVRLEARTGRDGLKISAPEPRTLGPGQRAPIRLRAVSTSIGVHQVSLVATTEDGAQIGSQVQFTVRTSNVGMVIWVVMGVAGAVLFVMIGFRILRRVRAYRSRERQDA
jgi:hypothetical protein